MAFYCSTFTAFDLIPQHSIADSQYTYEIETREGNPLSSETWQTHFLTANAESFFVIQVHFQTSNYLALVNFPLLCSICKLSS